MLYFYSGIILAIFMIEVREYFYENKKSPFTEWFNNLHGLAATKVATSLSKLQRGNTSSLKSVGEGVYESRLNWGPGYRIYLGKEDETLIILLGGGTKKTQQNDIIRAKILWKEYKVRKKENRYGTDS